MPGSYGHLVTRFFDYLAARPPTEAETNLIASRLTPSQFELFAQQDMRDRAHALHAASVVLASGTEDPDVLRAAILHDVGKRHAALGVIGRTIASVLIKLRLPMSRRMRLYRDHGEAGARDLEAAGSSQLVVDFTRSHHDRRPETIPADVWELLQLADQPAKQRVRPTPR